MPNVYEQHVPLVVNIVDSATKGRLSESEFPYLDSAPLKDIPKNIFIYIIGGVTFAEVKHINDLNKRFPESQFIIGGSSQINSKQFFEDYVL
jgi:vacuolar protein sorting-associated protein 45